MNYRNERMARGFRSLDAILEGVDPAKFPPLSDCGEGARRIRRGEWGDTARSERPPYRAARGERLAEAGLVRVATMSMKLKAKSSQAA